MRTQKEPAVLFNTRAEPLAAAVVFAYSSKWLLGTPNVFYFC